MGYGFTGSRASNSSSFLQPSEQLALQTQRWARLLAGLFLFGVAVVLMIRSGLGLGPWDAFHVGLHHLTGMTIGTTTIVVGLVIVVGTWFMGERPGPGTIANMILIGVFVDLLLPVVPEASGWLGLPYHLAGIGLTGIATGLYISPGLGKGPRDGLMLALAERTGHSVQRVRTWIELTALALGWTMGGKVGVGTLLFAFGIGPVTQWSLQWFGITTARRARSRAPVARVDQSPCASPAGASMKRETGTPRRTASSASGES